MALASHNVVRATQDVDLLTDSDVADLIDTELKKLGYKCLHRSDDVANYLRGDERVDFCFSAKHCSTRFSMTRNDTRAPGAAPQPIADSGGVVVRVESERDPYEILDDLMTVVESLCPTWPSRPTFKKSSIFLL